MSKSLTFQSNIFATLDIERIGGQQCVGVCRLFINVRFRWDEITKEDTLFIDKIDLSVNT